MGLEHENFSKVLHEIPYWRILTESVWSCQFFPSLFLMGNRIILILGFEVFTAVTAKNAFFWDVASCIYYKPTFRRKVSPPSSGKRNNASEKRC
jgi:hypothetical protein